MWRARWRATTWCARSTDPVAKCSWRVGRQLVDRCCRGCRRGSRVSSRSPSTTVNLSRLPRRQAAGRTVVYALGLDSVQESTGALAALLAIGLPALLVVVGATTWRMVGRALAPVDAIRSEVDTISASQLHRRVPRSGADDEIGRLADTMNRMLDRMERARSRERRFVADASHELRSPIAAIRQHAEVALAHPEHSPDLARVAHAESLRMQGLVDDLLLLAQADAHTLPFRRRPVDLDDLVLAEAARLRAQCDKVVDTHGVSAARVDGDAAALARVLANLGDNAARHAGTDRPHRLRTGRLGGAARRRRRCRYSRRGTEPGLRAVRAAGPGTGSRGRRQRTRVGHRLGDRRRPWRHGVHRGQSAGWGASDRTPAAAAPTSTTPFSGASAVMSEGVPEGGITMTRRTRWILAAAAAAVAAFGIGGTALARASSDSDQPITGPDLDKASAARARAHGRRSRHRDGGRRRGELLRGRGDDARRPADRRPARPELRRGGSSATNSPTTPVRMIGKD